MRIFLLLFGVVFILLPFTPAIGEEEKPAASHKFEEIVVTATRTEHDVQDAYAVLEGWPFISYAIYNSEPVFDLGLHRHPSLIATLHDLQPRDRLALWMVMRPNFQAPPLRPVSHRPLLAMQNLGILAAPCRKRPGRYRVPCSPNLRVQVIDLRSHYTTPAPKNRCSAYQSFSAANDH